jgi:DNA-binding transcriptional ArsR family regulator
VKGVFVSTEQALKAVGEAKRQTILRLLRDEDGLSVTDIGRRLGVTQQAASLHLKVLEDVGLVEARREGVRHLYSVRLAGFEPVEQFLREFWQGHLGDLRADLEKDD